MIWRCFVCIAMFHVKTAEVIGKYINSNEILLRPENINSKGIAELPSILDDILEFQTSVSENQELLSNIFIIENRMEPHLIEDTLNYNNNLMEDNTYKNQNDTEKQGEIEMSSDLNTLTEIERLFPMFKSNYLAKSQAPDKQDYNINQVIENRPLSLYSTLDQMDVSDDNKHKKGTDYEIIPDVLDNTNFGDWLDKHRNLKTNEAVIKPEIDIDNIYETHVKNGFHSSANDSNKKQNYLFGDIFTVSSNNNKRDLPPNHQVKNAQNNRSNISSLKNLLLAIDLRIKNLQKRNDLNSKILKELRKALDKTDMNVNLTRRQNPDDISNLPLMKYALLPVLIFPFVQSNIPAKISNLNDVPTVKLAVSETSHDLNFEKNVKRRSGKQVAFEVSNNILESITSKYMEDQISSKNLSEITSTNFNGIDKGLNDMEYNLSLNHNLANSYEIENTTITTHSSQNSPDKRMYNLKNLENNEQTGSFRSLPDKNLVTLSTTNNNSNETVNNFDEKGSTITLLNGNLNTTEKGRLLNSSFTLGENSRTVINKTDKNMTFIMPNITNEINIAKNDDVHDNITTERIVITSTLSTLNVTSLSSEMLRSTKTINQSYGIKSVADDVYKNETIPTNITGEITTSHASEVNLKTKEEETNIGTRKKRDLHLITNAERLHSPLRLRYGHADIEPNESKLVLDKAALRMAQPLNESASKHTMSKSQFEVEHLEEIKESIKRALENNRNDTLYNLKKIGYYGGHIQ